MTNKINGIDVSECPCKDDDKCLEAPIINEYGDLIDYQDCEPQTLCPYRSKTKIQRLQEENNILKQTIKNKNFVAIVEENEELKKKKDEYYLITLDYEAKISYLIQALEEIREITEQDRNCMNSELACCRLCDKLDLIKEKTNEVLK